MNEVPKREIDVALQKVNDEMKVIGKRSTRIPI